MDTNVAVALLLESTSTAAARNLFERDPAWCSEAFLLVEFSNVMATYVRQRLLSRDQGLALLEDAQRVFEGRLFEASHLDSLRMAGSLGVSAYDARFLVAAETLGTKLVTEDRRLRRAAAGVTLSLAETA